MFSMIIRLIKTHSFFSFSLRSCFLLFLVISFFLFSRNPQVWLNGDTLGVSPSALPYSTTRIHHSWVVIVQEVDWTIVSSHPRACQRGVGGRCQWLLPRRRTMDSPTRLLLTSLLQDFCGWAAGRADSVRLTLCRSQWRAESIFHARPSASDGGGGGRGRGGSD